MRRLQAELSTLAAPQKEVKMAPRASWAHCHSQAWAPRLTPSARGRAEVQGGSWWGRRMFHRLEEQQKLHLRFIYSGHKSPPGIKRERWSSSPFSPLPGTPSQHPFVASCSQTFRFYPNTRTRAFLFHGFLWQSVKPLLTWIHKMRQDFKGNRLCWNSYYSVGKNTNLL